MEGNSKSSGKKKALDNYFVVLNDRTVDLSVIKGSASYLHVKVNTGDQSMVLAYSSEARERVYMEYPVFLETRAEALKAVDELEEAFEIPSVLQTVISEFRKRASQLV